MFSRVSPRGPVFEISQNSVDGASIPPPPPRNPSTGPEARQHVRRPPTLNTAVPYQPGAAHLTTPLVTPSSLSSPFAQVAVHATSTGPVPGAASRGGSPDNHRLSGNFTNMAYNPQEWASGRQSVEARQRRDVYGEPLHTPPPPYPDRRSNTGQAFSSPSISVNASPVLQQASLAAEPASYTQAQRSNVITPDARQVYDSRRATRTANVASPEYSSSPGYPQYQPQQPNARHASSLSYQVGYANNVGSSHLPPPPRRSPPNVGGDHVLGFPHTRRSTSAGPVPTAGPSMTRFARTFSSQAAQDRSDWDSALPLPGPPPGPPPPPSTRSRSADTNPEVHHQGVRQRPPRLQIKNSNLAPIPATPTELSAVSGRDLPPLRIDTGGNSMLGKARAIAPSASYDDSQGSTSGPAPLARRDAVRGPAARSSTNPGRSRSKSVTRRDEPTEVPASTTVSTNPWASALEQTKSPMDINTPANARNNLSIETNLGQTQTPPVTPGAILQKGPTEQNQQAQQAKILPTPPLSQKPLLSANSINTRTVSQNKLDMDEDTFVTQAMERHAEFLKQEQEASTDVERLRLFTLFIQQESVLRKERYIVAYRSDDFDLNAAKDMLFSGGSKVRRASGRETDPAPSVDQSPAAASTASSHRNDANNWREYRPALSPIASMDYDEQSSRGRAPSRWWESAPPSHSDDISQSVARTKRESKYMSLSKKLWQSMENEMEPLYEDSPRQSQYPDEKANPDTFGYYEEEPVQPLTANSQRRMFAHSALDISRFITLPPPYPRHFPAVNNNHPDLTEYRTTVRTLSDLSDAKDRQSRHKTNIETVRADRQTRVADNRKLFRTNLQSQVAEGSLSYAEAAEAERMLTSQEHDLEKQELQNEFSTLQDVVINPVHEQLNARIEQLGKCLESLQGELFRSAANQDPDQPVQEGDDVPELLEQLTQLKWLFETRETLHQELFNLVTQRNDAYKAIVALPYHQNNNMDKIRDTDAFFAKDAATRYVTFCAEALKRHESFLQFMEDNALRGIEMQSSAFWDITPGLVDLLQKIPTDLHKLDINIPDSELDENPAYQEHPLQYLYILLRHAERSSYQYIEGQVNLHCIVHEVKTSSLAAKYKASKAQQEMAGDGSTTSVGTQHEDEGRLTQELQNRATLIEEQWQDALGRQLDVVKGRVRKQLQKRGAWDDIAAETEG